VGAADVAGVARSDKCRSGRFQENGGLRIRGGAAAAPASSSIRSGFFNRGYGAGSLKYPLFEDEGAQEFDKFDLRTSQNYSWPRNESPTYDTMVREVFCRKTLGDMGQPYRRSRYYHLYLNGQYWGLYETDERPQPITVKPTLAGPRRTTTWSRITTVTSPLPPPFHRSHRRKSRRLVQPLVMCQMMRTNASNENYFRPLGRTPTARATTTCP